MATSNGPWQNHARIEWVYSVESIDQNSTDALASVQAYLRMDGSSSQNYGSTRSWSGHWGSDSSSVQVNLGPNQRALMVTGGAPAVTLTDSTQQRTFTVSVSHFFGTTASTLYVTYPARYAVTPSSLTATRVSDAQIDLAWTRNSTYTSVVVQRRTDDGVWQEIARPTGNPASFSDTTTVAGHKYEYRVAGIGGSGQSAFTSAVTAYTSPGAPTGVSAVRSGSDIVVSASTVPPYATAFDVWDDATSAVVGSDVNLPWTHVAPSASVAHAYKVRGVIGSLDGAYSVLSNTVQLIAPPNAPVSLSPNGGVAASDVDVRFSWTHNPVDSSPQSAYSLQYRLVGAGAWTTVTGTTDEYRDVSLTAGDYEWQVKTKGAHASYSPLSALATVEVITRPGVAVTQPDADWELTVLTVKWSWTQAQSKPQSAWRTTLYDDAMAQIEQLSGSGAAGEAVFAHRIVDAESYTVQVEAATGEVWSAVASQAFVGDFQPPAAPVISASWDEDTGSVTVHVDEGAGTGSEPATTVLDLDRSVDGGDVWESILDGVAPDITVVDFESLSYGDTKYRVTAYTATGASAETIVTVEARSGAVWLGGGAGFAVCGRLPLNPSVDAQFARSRAERRYAGRTLPVAYAGEQVTRGYTVSGVTADETLSGEVTAAVELLDQIATESSPVHVLRDPDGRRVYGLIGEVEVSRDTVTAGTVKPWNGIWGYSFGITQTGR